MDLVGPVTLPLELAGDEHVASWFVGRVVRPERDDSAVEEVSVLQFGEASGDGARPLVRVHSACLTGDTLGSVRCDCGPQLRGALAQIADASSGSLLIYMTSHEGRGIGLWSKAAAYLLQEEGMDTYEANRALAFEDDQRDFRLAAAIVRHFFGEGAFDLLTNNPLKMKSLERFAVKGFRRRELVEGTSTHNRCYLKAKRDHGHLLPG